MLPTKEFTTQEIMQYAIVLIEKIGFQTTKTYNSTKNKIICLLEDFKREQYIIQDDYEVVVNMDEFYSKEVENEADEILQYYSCIDYKRMGNQVDIYKAIKGIALNYYCTKKEFGTICYMCYAYMKRKDRMQLKAVC